MRRSKTGLDRLSRAAAIRLCLCAAVVLGSCFLLMQATAWKDLRHPETEPFYTELPGVDLSGIPDPAREALLKRLNVQRCPCECGRTVASCRNHHGSCGDSLVIARAAAAEAKKVK